MAQSARTITRNLLRTLDDAGFKVERVDDGDPTGQTVKVGSIGQAITTAFAVGEASIWFGSRRWVLIIPENGEDVISDYSCSDEAFTQVVDAFLDNIAVTI